MQSDSIAQSFMVDVPENITGCFLQSVTLYFKRKSPNDNVGVEIFICETNLGLPDISTALGSAYKPAKRLPVSEDASVGAEFNFREPIFVNNLQEYAIVMKVDGSAPDFEVWCCEIGGQDVTTGESVNQNPRVGTLYISGNELAWTPVQTEDLKFSLTRALFTETQGTVRFRNDREEFVTMNDFTKLGGNSVLPGDIVVFQRVGPNSNPLIVPDNENFYHGEVKSIDETNSKIILDKSNGNLLTGFTYQIHRPKTTQGNIQETVTTPGILNNQVFDSSNPESDNSLLATFEVESIDNPNYHMIVPKFIDMIPERTSLNYRYRGTANNLNTDTSTINVKNNYETEFLDYERIYVSRTNERENNIQRNTFFEIDLRTNSEYVSPIVDIRAPQAILIRNIINDDSENEHTKRGNALTRYISRKITLDQNLGNAEDMLAYVGAYRPQPSDFEVYLKIKNPNDPETFDDKLWTKMVFKTGKNVYSESGNREDAREYEFVPPVSDTNDFYQFEENAGSTAYINDNGVLEYKDISGGAFVGYNEFAFKIVLLSSNPVHVPLLRDFRCISLQA